LAGLPVVAQANPNWATFVPADKSFQIEMPDTPSVTHRDRDLVVAHFVSTVYKAHRGPDTFGVNHTDIPKAILMVTSDRYILKSTRDGFLESSGALEVSFAPSRVDDQSAGELRYRIPAGDEHPALNGTARILLVGNRLFIFYAEVSPATPPEEINRYLASIRIPARASSSAGEDHGAAHSPSPQ
jgi:hypothetical protein